MSNNPETCQCKSCYQWREIVKSICDGKNLDYDTVTRSDKTELFNIFIHHSKEDAENIWDISKSKYKYAMKI